MKDLVRTFAENILEKYHSRNILTSIKRLFKGITPSLSFTQDGTPSLSLALSEGQIETSLGQLFKYLENRNKSVIVAVAKEGIVQKPSSIAFLMKHKLPSASSTLQAINTLTTNEVVYKKHDGYVVCDAFFKRFLEKYL